MRNDQQRTSSTANEIPVCYKCGRHMRLEALIQTRRPDQLACARRDEPEKPDPNHARRNGTMFWDHQVPVVWAWHCWCGNLVFGRRP